MKYLHTGLCSSSEKNADLFFQDVLGLAKSESFVFPAELIKGIFGINSEMKAVNYKAEGIRFEVFIDPSYKARYLSMAHSGLEVENLTEFLKKCEDKRIKVSRTPKGDSFVIFITDPDGNLFEIKEKKPGV
jgi:catechol 2,3-dioxygenase-like lactoylglutathione lyase family enzyme